MEIRPEHQVGCVFCSDVICVSGVRNCRLFYTAYYMWNCCVVLSYVNVRFLHAHSSILCDVQCSGKLCSEKKCRAEIYPEEPSCRIY